MAVNVDSGRVAVMQSNRAVAGSCGPGVRCDCRVEITQAQQGPVLRVLSRVHALYGESICRLAEDTLNRLGLRDISMVIEDAGALPFTIMARIEAAAARCAGHSLTEVLPEINPATRYGSSRQRLRRTRLYIPGNTPRFFPNAGLHLPDIVILDLEDSVPPDQKDIARILVRNALRAVNFYGAEKVVRINAPPLGLDDVRALAPHGVHTFVLPKVEDPAVVRAVDQLARDVRSAHGQPDEIFLIPTVESPRGAFHALEIAEASSSVVALGIGLEDYVKEIGAERTPEGRESWWLAGQVINAARAAGVQPLASVYPDIENTEGLQRYAIDARAAGFEGVGCIHPRQVRVVHDAFAPRPAQIEQARRIVEAFETAEAEGRGAAALDGRMIDRPVVERARRLLLRSSSGEKTE